MPKTIKTKPIAFHGDVTLWVDEDSQLNVGLNGPSMTKGVRVATSMRSGAGKELYRQILLSKLSVLDADLALHGIELNLNADSSALTIADGISSFGINSIGGIVATASSPDITSEWRIANVAQQAMDLLSWDEPVKLMDSLIVHLLWLAKMTGARIDPEQLVLAVGECAVGVQREEGQTYLFVSGVSAKTVRGLAMLISGYQMENAAAPLIIVSDIEPLTMNDYVEIPHVLVAQHPEDGYSDYLKLHAKDYSLFATTSGQLVHHTRTGQREANAQQVDFYHRIVELLEAEDVREAFTPARQIRSARRDQVRQLLAAAGVRNIDRLTADIFSAMDAS